MLRPHVAKALLQFIVRTVVVWSHSNPIFVIAHDWMTLMADDSWSIWIDIEGFSNFWDQDKEIIRALRHLMTSIFRIATLCYPDTPDRLFVHQLGDGFLIVSDFHEPSLERCVAVAVTLMRQVAATGFLARASISEGYISDITGLYPKEIQDAWQRDNFVPLHSGIMTLTPVMGSALIRAVGLDKIAPRGPILSIASDKLSRTGASNFTYDDPQNKYSRMISLIDWVHMDSKLLDIIYRKSKMKPPSTSSIEGKLRDYIGKYPEIKSEWKDSAGLLLRRSADT